MDYLPIFEREVRAFEKAVGRAAEEGDAPLVPSCPGWSMADLVMHLGGVHRMVEPLIKHRLTAPIQADPGKLGLPAARDGWPDPANAPNRGPIPATLIDWFAEGARALETQFRTTDPAERVWTWSAEQTVGFWVRMQTIEAAIHRWDAELAVGEPRPMEPELAEDAVAQTFEVMAPARRWRREALPGSGERFLFRQTDGTGSWTVRFEGDEVRFAFGDTSGEWDVELAGTASNLMLFLWQRIPAERLDVNGDKAVLDRYFSLVPPV